MKCCNCHGDRINNKQICEMCGFNNKKFKKSRNRINNGINFFQKYGKLIKIILILIILSFIILPLFFIEDGSIIEIPVFSLVILLLPFLIKFISIGFVSLIAISLIKQGLVALRVNRSTHIADGKVVDIKDIKEIAEGPDFKDNFAPIIEYDVYGYKYRIVGDYQTEGIIVGQNKQIKYNPKKPFEAVTVGSKISSSSLGLGLFLLVICIIFLFI